MSRDDFGISPNLEGQDATIPDPDLVEAHAKALDRYSPRWVMKEGKWQLLPYRLSRPATSPPEHPLRHQRPGNRS